MKNDDKVVYYFTRLTNLTHQMKSCSEFMAYEVMIILTTKFDHIVVEIEETKKLSDDKSEDM